jgi:hypothetical protein
LGNEFPKLALLVLAPLQSPCSALVGPDESPRPPDLLSWDSSRPCRSRSPRPLPPTSPPSVHSRQASLPGFGLRGTTSEVAFRPRGFAPPRRFAPLDGSRACCIPQPVVGFVAFPCAPTCEPRGPKTERAAPASPSPRRVSYPPKDSPRPQPYRITAALAPLPLLPSLSARLPATPFPGCPLLAPRRRPLGFEALLRVRVRTSSRPFPAGRRPVLPWASLPSKVLRCRAFNRDATPTLALRPPKWTRSSIELRSAPETTDSELSVATVRRRPTVGLHRSLDRRRMPRSARGGAGTRETTMRASRS